MVYATGRPRAFCKDQFLISTNEGAPIYKSPFAFLNEYDLEMKSIHAALVNHPEYHWVIEYVSDKRDNYNGSFVNVIMCYWENVLLEIAVKYFRDSGLEILVPMFDGLMVARMKKMSQEYDEYQPRELCSVESSRHCAMLNEICKHVLGIDVKWVTKPLVDKRLAVPDDFDPGTLMPLFDELVGDFNERNKNIGENYLTINRDGSFSIRTKDKFKDYHNHIGYFDGDKVVGRRERFVLKWLDDYDYPPGVRFEAAREYPPGGPPDRSQCPDDVFNIWEPLDFEKWDGRENPDGTPFVYDARAVEMFEDMVMGLSGDSNVSFTWLMQWLYTMLKYPATKCGRFPFIVSTTGIGKDTLIMILQKIIGYMRCVTEPDPAENLFGKFNDVMMGTYLLIMTEVSMKDLDAAMGRQRHLTTQYEFTLNLKGGAKIPKYRSFHRFMAITNPKQGESAPVALRDDERRIVLMYAVARLKGNTAFWNEFYARFDGEHPWNAIRSVLQFILTFEHGPMFADSEIPMTEFHRQAIVVDPIKRFIRDYANESISDGESIIPSKELWQEFVAWCSKSNERLTMNDDGFGKQLTRMDIHGVGRPKSKKATDGSKKVFQARLLNFSHIRSFVASLDVQEDSGAEDWDMEEEKTGELDDVEVGESCTDLHVLRQEVPSTFESEAEMQQRLDQMDMECDELQRSIRKFESNPEDEYHKYYQENPESCKDSLSLKDFKKMMAKQSENVRNLNTQMCTLSQTLYASKKFAAAPPCEFKLIEIKDFSSAGVILYNTRGYWLGFERTGGKRFWTDYGGKRECGESAWETAVRECKEEVGIDISECVLKRAPDFQSDSQAKHVIFWVEVDATPIRGHHANFLDHKQFTEWPKHELHPRLLYDKRGKIKQTREELGFH